MYNGKELDVVADVIYLGMTSDCKVKFFKGIRNGVFVF